MPMKNVDQLGQEKFEGLTVACDGEIAIDGVKVPKSGVGGVIKTRGRTLDSEI